MKPSKIVSVKKIVNCYRNERQQSGTVAHVNPNKGSGLNKAPNQLYISDRAHSSCCYGYSTIFVNNKQKLDYNISEND